MCHVINIQKKNTCMCYLYPYTELIIKVLIHAINQFCNNAKNIKYMCSLIYFL